MIEHTARLGCARPTQRAERSDRCGTLPVMANCGHDQRRFAVMGTGEREVVR